MNQLKGYMSERLKEASTWRGIVAILAALGIGVTPDQADAIVATGLATIGALGAFFPDRKA